MIQGIQFAIRRAFLGRIVLRWGLPQVPAAALDDQERAYYRGLFAASMPRLERQKITRVIDIGCRNWSYAPALADSFEHANYVGIEVDGYRRYWNMYRRIDYAQAHAAALAGKACALHGDFRNQVVEPAADGLTLFCFLFPFVTPEPCLRWGLPSQFADYPALLQHALAQPFASTARWLCVHQGEREAALAQAIYESLGLTMKAIKRGPETWAGIWPSPHDNWIFVGQRTASWPRQRTDSCVIRKF